MREAAGQLVAFGIMEAKLGKADDLMDLLKESLYETLKMEGVKDAYIAQAPDDPNRFFSYSCWESLSAYDSMQLDFAGRQERMGISGLLVSPPVWGTYMIIE